MTSWVHGDAAIARVETANRVFATGTLDGVSADDYPRSPLRSRPSICRAASSTRAWASSIPLARTVSALHQGCREAASSAGGGAYVNNVKVSDDKQKVTLRDLATETMLVLRSGKNKLPPGPRELIPLGLGGLTPRTRRTHPRTRRTHPRTRRTHPCGLGGLTRGLGGLTLADSADRRRGPAGLTRGLGGLTRGLGGLTPRGLGGLTPADSADSPADSAASADSADSRRGLGGLTPRTRRTHAADSADSRRGLGGFTPRILLLPRRLRRTGIRRRVPLLHKLPLQLHQLPMQTKAVPPPTRSRSRHAQPGPSRPQSNSGHPNKQRPPSLSMHSESHGQSNCCTGCCTAHPGSRCPCSTGPHSRRHRGMRHRSTRRWRHRHDHTQSAPQ